MRELAQVRQLRGRRPEIGQIRSNRFERIGVGVATDALPGFVGIGDFGLRCRPPSDPVELSGSSGLRFGAVEREFESVIGGLGTESPDERFAESPRHDFGHRVVARLSAFDRCGEACEMALQSARLIVADVRAEKLGQFGRRFGIVVLRSTGQQTAQYIGQRRQLAGLAPAVGTAFRVGVGVRCRRENDHAVAASDFAPSPECARAVAELVWLARENVVCPRRSALAGCVYRAGLQRRPNGVAHVGGLVVTIEIEGDCAGPANVPRDARAGMVGEPLSDLRPVSTCLVLPAFAENRTGVLDVIGAGRYQVHTRVRIRQRCGWRVLSGHVGDRGHRVALVLAVGGHAAAEDRQRGQRCRQVRATRRPALRRLAVEREIVGAERNRTGRDDVARIDSTNGRKLQNARRSVEFVIDLWCNGHQLPLLRGGCGGPILWE
nr:hypothetical protein [Mycobacterium barrassiae]